MTNITPMQAHIDNIRRHLDAPSGNLVRNAAMMLADALRDAHLNRAVMIQVVAALINHDEAQQIERAAYMKERV